MAAFRFFMVLVILLIASFAWLILGSTIKYRTADLEVSLSEEVNSLWGPADLVQAAPYVAAPGGRTDPLRSDVQVHFEHHNRYKGLLWFSTYTVEFSGTYKVVGKPERRSGGTFVLQLPEDVPFFQNLRVTLDGEPFECKASADGRQILSVLLPGVGDFPDASLLTKAEALFEARQYDAVRRRLGWIDRNALAWPERNRYDTLRRKTDEAVNALGDQKLLAEQGREHVITVHYETRGRDRWQYLLTNDPSGQTAHVQDFTLTATMDFLDIDYPDGTMSPTAPAQETLVPSYNAETGQDEQVKGMKAVWRLEDARSRQRIGIEMPLRLNAGVIAGRMASYAPVSLLFFFTVLFTIVILKKVPLHPMHYLFIAAGFFAFHILLAYLVDKIEIRGAFWISAAVSVLLVISYMRLVAGARFAVLYVGAAQLVYLIGFSYAFFWTGWTGLTIVIVAILTLAVLMQATGRVDWNEMFSRPAPKPPLVKPPVVKPKDAAT